MKKVVFFILGTVFSVSIFATTINPTPKLIFNNVSDTNTNIQMRGPVNRLDLRTDLTDGGLRGNDGEYVVDVYQYSNYIQVLIKQKNTYTIVIENSIGEVYSTTPVNSSQSTVNVPTLFYPDDYYRITIYNADGSSSIYADFYIGD